MITEKSDNGVFFEGLDVVLSCRVNSVPIPTVAQWFRNGVIVDEVPDRIVIRFDGDLLELQLYKAVENDTAIYTCLFNNSLIPVVVTETIVLSVTTEGKIPFCDHLHEYYSIII